MALRCSPANQYPLAALKQRNELVHPLPHAAGLLTIFSTSVNVIGYAPQIHRIAQPRESPIASQNMIESTDKVAVSQTQKNDLGPENSKS
jgi:hypothetical protein